MHIAYVILLYDVTDHETLARPNFDDIHRLNSWDNLKAPKVILVNKSVVFDYKICN